MTLPSVPLAVQQALSDTALPATARLLMWHLALRLDLLEFRAQKLESLAMETRTTKQNVSANLELLLRKGYLDARPGERRGRLYRLPLSRRTTEARAA